MNKGERKILNKTNKQTNKKSNKKKKQKKLTFQILHFFYITAKMLTLCQQSSQRF